MTKKEILALVEYSRTTEGVSDGCRIRASVKNGERPAEDLTEREIVLFANNRWFDFEDVMRFGKDDEVVEAFRLARESISTGKSFHANRDMAEGVFRSDEDAREYAEKIRFHMYLI